MMKLSKDFSLEKYGLKVRLVNEDDADFILSLRSSPNRTKHMITLDFNIESQRIWIHEYMKRERDGFDYYFIYSNVAERPIGLNRISHVDFNAKSCKLSSWIAVEGLEYEALDMLMIRNEIAFNSLGIDMAWGEVHKKNSNVIRILNLFGYKLEDIGTEFYNFSLSKTDFLNACEKSIISKLKGNKTL